MFHCGECGKEYRWSKDYDHPVTNKLELVDPETFVCCGKKLLPGFKPTGFVSIGSAGDYEHISESLGINPLDIEEHRKNWPNIEALPDGRLKFTSVKQQQEYANHFGLDKAVQRRR